MRWIVLFRGAIDHIPDVVHVGEEGELDISLSVLYPISPIVAWIHYTSVFPKHAARVQDLEANGNARSTIALMAGELVCDWWKRTEAKNQAINPENIIRKFGWPLWLLRYTDRLVRDTYDICGIERALFPRKTLMPSQMNEFRLVAIVYDTIGEEAFVSVFGTN